MTEKQSARAQTWSVDETEKGGGPDKAKGAPETSDFKKGGGPDKAKGEGAKPSKRPKRTDRETTR
jgi:hypothetical protein